MSPGDVSVGLSLEDILGAIELRCKRFMSWFREHRCPKTKPDHIGVAIGLMTEGEVEKTRLENDFLSELQSHLGSRTAPPLFHFMKLPQKFVKQITSPAEALDILNRSKAHLVVWGKMVLRKDKGIPNYVFRLDAIVRHSHVSTNVSKSLATEMNTVFPRKFYFPEDEELMGFELSQQWVGLAVVYICAAASFISNDPFLSLQLLDQLRSDVDCQFGEEKPEFAIQISERIKEPTVWALFGICRINFESFRESRDRTHIKKSWKPLQRLLACRPDLYTAQMWKAIALFFNGEAHEAIEYLRGVKPCDLTYHYSLGFLLSFVGDINGALREYQKTLNHPVPAPTLLDIDVFLTEVIIEHPEKAQLLFFRGVVNLKGKEDKRLAKEDFEGFLSNKQSSDYPKLVDMAKKYVIDASSP